MSNLNKRLKGAVCACALIGSSLSVCALLGGSAALAQQYPNSQTAPDNSARNREQMPNADQQKENSEDRETARKIRQALVEDKMLSKYAQNVKVIAENGMVTLRGPVRSDEEKHMVVEKAAEVAGKDNVTDELTVKHEGSD